MKKVQQVPIVQQVVDSITEYIQTSGIAVGEKLPTEKEFCETLSVGRGTLREALRILQTKGLVEIKPGRGAFVARLSEEDSSSLVEWFIQNEADLTECIEVRFGLEPVAIKLAITRCSDADIARLSEIHEAFVNAVHERDILKIAELDQRFHNQIVEMSRNKLLISINKKVSSCIVPFRDRTFQIPENAEHAIEPHTNIMRAIASRDVEAGELFMKRHLQRVIDDMSVMFRK